VSSAAVSLRATFAGLTTRGRSLAAAGATLAACAVALGQRDLMRVAVLLMALPLCAVALVSRTRFRLSCTRHLDPQRVEAGRTATVRIRLDNVSRLPSGVLLVEDALPYGLGSRPRFVLDRVQPRGLREVSYPVSSEVRGRFRVGPLSLRLTDPFGLVELTRSFSAADELVVTPVVSPLPPVSLGGHWTGGGEAATRAVAMSGDDDAATREYRDGDDLRKVHWRSTARVGELMVRREEQPFTSRATLLLDDRETAHRGQGPASSLEWAVSAVASVGVMLLRHGYALRLLDGSDRELVPPGLPVTESVLLESLADVTATRRATLAPVGDLLRRTGTDGLLVAVLGSVDSLDAERLARLRRGGGRCVAILLDTATWVSDHAGGPRYREAATLLRRNGWRVLEVAHGTTLASVWPLAAPHGREAGVGR
jgi:uncharacterized protein (DUF58 family)